jgi:RHS repeat-associated protein
MGNLTGDGTNTYTWDARDRLTSITGGVAATFAYDPFGRRTRKTISAQTTDYLYDGNNPVQELSGGAVLANLLTSLGIDEYFTRTDGSGRRSLLGDALGSILALTDDAGVVQTSYTYEPFGQTAVTGQANGNPLQYTGRENDGTGLYYYRARYYSPTRQRFIAQDPIGLAGGDANLYAYAGDSPIAFVDPFGLDRADRLEFSTFGGLQLRASGPFGGVDVSIGFRSGTERLGRGRIEGFANARALATGGAAAGRGFFVGAALRDVSKVAGLTEVFVDTPLGGISLLFEGHQVVGAALAGPSKGLAAGVSASTFPGVEVARGIEFPTDLSPYLFRPVGNGK